MVSKQIILQRYDADDGKVFDWLIPRFEGDLDGNPIRQHLYAKTIYLGSKDSINNYIEIDEPVEEVEEDEHTTN